MSKNNKNEHWSKIVFNTKGKFPQVVWEDETDEKYRIVAHKTYGGFEYYLEAEHKDSMGKSSWRSVDEVSEIILSNLVATMLDLPRFHDDVPKNGFKQAE